MDGNLPIIDYDRYDSQADFGPVLEKCPTKSLIFVGKPEREIPGRHNPKEVVRAPGSRPKDRGQQHGVSSAASGSCA